VSISTVEAKAITTGLPRGRLLPSDPLAEAGKTPANGSGINMFMSLRNIIGFPCASNGGTGSCSSKIHTVVGARHRAEHGILSAAALAATANIAMPA
jgi:hypothetical protein